MHDSAPRRQSVCILGVRVDDVTTDEALQLMVGYIEEGQRDPSAVHQVVTVNPEFVMRAQRDPTFRVVLQNAQLAIPDGVGLLWAARVLGCRLRERVTGSDTVPLLARECAARGHRLFLLGAAPGVAEQAARELCAANPGLQIAGTYAGSPAASEEDGIVARIVASRPRVLLVAYGAPAQDVWIARNLARLGVPLCIGVGGTLDFLAGVAQRAPAGMRRMGVEWLYRLLREPRRWRRMLALPHFWLLVMREALGRKGRSQRARPA